MRKIHIHMLIMCTVEGNKKREDWCVTYQSSFAVAYDEMSLVK